GRVLPNGDLRRLAPAPDPWREEGRGGRRPRPFPARGAQGDLLAWHGSSFPSRAQRLRTVSTGQGARRITRSATLPRRTLERPLRPWVPITIRSARRRRAIRGICS